MKPSPKQTRMNKNEECYSHHLESLKMSENILDWKYEPFGVRLAEQKCYYHPDFFVAYPTHFEVHEVKPYQKKKDTFYAKDDAMVKVKVASGLFYFWRFFIVYFDGVEWVKKPLK